MKVDRLNAAANRGIQVRWDHRKHLQAMKARLAVLADPQREFLIPLDHLVRQHVLMARDFRRAMMLGLGVRLDELEAWERERQ